MRCTCCVIMEDGENLVLELLSLLDSVDFCKNVKLLLNVRINFFFFLNC